MINSKTKKMVEGKYYFSADMLRIVLVIILILARYGLPFMQNSLSYCMNFAPGALFMLYGCFVLKDGNDLRKYIKHTLKIFLIMFVVCFVLAAIDLLILYGKPFAYLTKRGIFNFLVLNYWGPSAGDYIWYVQSALYSLVLCYIFRKFKKYDVIICIVLFIVAFFLGEGAGIIHFDVLGYTYIPGNFLTRTLPYMLLGRIIYRKREKLKELKKVKFIALIIVGFILCFAELWALVHFNMLVYYGHLLGYILISCGLVGIALRSPHFAEEFGENRFELYKKLFFLFNPVGEIAFLAFYMFVTTQEQYNFVSTVSGVIIALLCILFAFIWDSIEKAVKRRKEER